MKRVGFVGLGTMGKGMARNLLKKGFELSVYDTNPSVVEEMASYGAEKASTLRSLGDSCRSIIFCLPNTSIIQKVIFGSPLADHNTPTTQKASKDADCLLDSLREDDVLIDCGTTHPLWTQQTHSFLKEKKVAFVDAPISGLKARAEAGTLSIMVGGEENVFNQVRPALAAMGEEVVLMGGAGSGQLAKMANNVLFNVSIAAMSEMLPLAVKFGLDPEKLAKSVSAGSGQSFGFDFFAPLALKRDFGPGYPLQDAWKDMGVIREMAEIQQIELPPVISGTIWTYEEALKAGYGKENKGAMIKVWEKLLHVQVGHKPNTPDTDNNNNKN